jgi:predicted nucleic-acid-binding Zn-ribbon protein
MQATSVAEVIAQEPIRYDCPKCASPNAVAQQIKHVGKAYGLITVMVTKENVVRCVQCQHESRASISPEEFALIAQDQVADHIQPKIAFITKFCIILSILFCVAAMLTLPAAIYGLIAVKGKSPGWTKLAIAGTVLSSFFMVVFVAVMIHEAR